MLDQTNALAATVTYDVLAGHREPGKLTGRQLRFHLAAGATFKTRVLLGQKQWIELTAQQIRPLVARIAEDEATHAEAWHDDRTESVTVYL